MNPIKKILTKFSLYQLILKIFSANGFGVKVCRRFVSFSTTFHELFGESRYAYIMFKLTRHEEKIVGLYGQLFLVDFNASRHN